MTLRATKVLPAGSWQVNAADRLVLDYDARHRRRVTMTGEIGLSFLLDLPQATHLHDGDGLMLDDGRIVAIRSAPESLLEITASDLARIAWHIGNRHALAQIDGNRILIRRDPVLARMLEGLGATVREVSEPFDPEGGAYGGHGHDH